MLDKVVMSVQAATAILVVVVVAMLFLNDPVSPPQPAGDIDVPAGIDAAALYGRSCAGCHGGDGSGGIGPPLKAARVIERFPTAADQAAVVADGRGGMPAFAGRVSAEEIDAIVEYTRTSL